jgi:hypothetical protein
MRHYGTRAESEGWGKVLVVIIVILAAIIMVNNAYLGYKDVAINQLGVSCENGVFKAATPVNITGFCDEYVTSRCVLKCVQNAPVCKCESSIFNQMFFAPGDYPH